MSQGMVRPAIVLAVVAFAGSAHGSELPRSMGMYTAHGTSLAMLDSKVEVHVRGPIVEAVVVQTFRNDTELATEATYIFPLPVDAAVSAMAIKTGTRTIHAAIEKREQAQDRYEHAVAAGLGAGLLDQERPDVFTQTVSAIPARGTVEVTLRFDTTARYQTGTWELVLPMVVAPRYVPGTASGRPTTGTGRAPDTDRSPDASRVTPGGAPGAGGKTDVAIQFADAVDDVTSPTHELVKADRGYTFSDAKSDHDAIVRWRAHVKTVGWVEADADGGFAAVVVEAPPAAPRTGALRCVVVLDRSATTRGDGDAVEHPLVHALLGGLGAKDRVSVTGSDRIDWGAADVASRTLDDSWPRPAGAFDLSTVLGATRAAGAAVVLVTDGLVADDRAVIAAAAKVGGPIHVIGIGPAPNRSLLARIASSTGGTVRFVALGDDVTAIARDVLADAATPPAPLAVTWGTLAARDVVPATLPRLGANQAALVIARVERALTANARARGDVFLLASITSPRAPDGATTARGGLGRRWARMKLDELVEAGNATTIAQHALRYGLVSPYTSMVAIGDEVVVEGGVKHSVPVPVSVPAGMRWQAVERAIHVDTTGGRDVSELKKHGYDAEENPVREKAKQKQDKRAADEDAGSDDYRARSSEPTQPPPAPVAMGSSAAGDSGGEREAAEDVTVAAYESASRRSVLRLAFALGAGATVVNGDADFVLTHTLRLDVGGRTRFGLEGSLWLVGGLHAQGEVLGTIARRGIARWFELRGGLGLHLGGDAGNGPALSLTLRTRLPVPHLATYLRYDGALLFHGATSDGQNTGSFGFEASW
jgi:Ca-activated chloride channel family protein